MVLALFALLGFTKPEADISKCRKRVTVPFPLMEMTNH